MYIELHNDWDTGDLSTYIIGFVLFGVNIFGINYDNDGAYPTLILGFMNFSLQFDFTEDN